MKILYRPSFVIPLCCYEDDRLQKYDVNIHCRHLYHVIHCRAWYIQLSHGIRFVIQS